VFPAQLIYSMNHLFQPIFVLLLAQVSNCGPKPGKSKPCTVQPFSCNASATERISLGVPGKPCTKTAAGVPDFKRKPECFGSAKMVGSFMLWVDGMRKRCCQPNSTRNMPWTSKPKPCPPQAGSSIPILKKRIPNNIAPNPSQMPTRSSFVIWVGSLSTAQVRCAGCSCGSSRPTR
jgi:hypothetical protein